jgi:hypothetical protein
MTIYRHHDEALTYNGMSLRDWFAGQALIGIVANVSGLTQRDEETAEQYFARLSYANADAMLAERAKASEHPSHDQTSTGDAS